MQLPILQTVVSDLLSYRHTFFVLLGYSLACFLIFFLWVFQDDGEEEEEDDSESDDSDDLADIIF